MPSICANEIVGIDFIVAKIDGTEFSGTEKAGTKLNGTKIFGTKIFGTEFVGTELAGTELTGTELAGTELAAPNWRYPDSSTSIYYLSLKTKAYLCVKNLFIMRRTRRAMSMMGS